MPLLLISPHKHKSEHSKVPLLNKGSVLSCSKKSLDAAIGQRVQATSPVPKETHASRVGMPQSGTSASRPEDKAQAVRTKEKICHASPFKPFRPTANERWPLPPRQYVVLLINAASLMLSKQCTGRIQRVLEAHVMLALASATCCSGSAGCLCVHDSPSTHIHLFHPRILQSVRYPQANSKTTTTATTHNICCLCSSTNSNSKANNNDNNNGKALESRLCNALQYSHHFWMQSAPVTFFEQPQQLESSQASAHPDRHGNAACLYVHKVSHIPTHYSSSTTNVVDAAFRLALACKPCTPPAPAVPLHCVAETAHAQGMHGYTWGFQAQKQLDKERKPGC